MTEYLATWSDWILLRGNQHFIDKSLSTTQLSFSWGPSMWGQPLRWGPLTPHYGDHLPLISGATNPSLWGTINPSLWGGASHHYLALWWNVLVNKPHASGPASGPTLGPTSGHASGHAPGHALAYFTWHQLYSVWSCEAVFSDWIALNELRSCMSYAAE
jgi:hypothetical protein